MYDDGMALGTLKQSDLGSNQHVDEVPDRPVAGRVGVGLEDRLAELCGQRNVLDARLVALMAEVLASGVWEVSGITSASHWLAWKAGLSTAHARRVVAMARRRGVLPYTFAAFDAGVLSVDQVAPIVAKVPVDADGEVCEFAKLATVAQLGRVVRSYGFEPDPTTGGDHGSDVEPRAEHVSLSHLDDGGWQLRGWLDADHGAIVDAALREARDALFQRDGGRVGNVEALVEIAERSLDAVGDPARRDRFRVHVHLDTANTMLDALGHRLPDWLRDLICCDTTLSPVFETDRIPVSVGRTQRTVPERTRRLVILRDRGCRVPGCSADRFLHVHHVIHWDPDDGEGPTDTWNLACVCPHHHRLHHQGLLGITGNADLVDGLGVHRRPRQHHQPRITGPTTNHTTTPTRRPLPTPVG
jgi:hypothetical protein